MKKALLSAFAFALSLGMNAQATFHNADVQLQQGPATTQQRVITLSPKKLDLQSNQRLLGYYTTDELAERGLGIPNYGKNPNAKAGIELTPDMLEAYDGMKIVAIRFGLAYQLEKSRVFIAPVSENGDVLDDAVSQDVESTVMGWNMVTLNNPYTISGGDDLVIGFDFNQKATKNGTSYSQDCFPLSVVKSGRTDMNLLLYAKINSKEGWYNFGTSNGNLSIQVVVEGNFADYAASPRDFGIVEGGINEETSANLTFNNMSIVPITDIDYVITLDGVAGAEQHATFDESIAQGYDGTVKVKIPACTEIGDHKFSVEITKVNGKENQAFSKVANGTLALAKIKFQRNLVLEEFTTEQCPQCPNGAKILNPALKAADHSRVFGVCHHSGYYTDWLTGTWDNDITYLLFGGTGSTFAPAISFNRNADIWDGVGVQVLGVLGSVGAMSTPLVTAMINSKLEEKANAGLEINVVPNNDETQATVTVKGTCNNAFDKDNYLLTLYLTEDSVNAKQQSGASGLYYHMHVIRYNNSSWGEKVTWNDDDTFTATFNVDLKAGWKKRHLAFVAFLNKHNTKNYADNIIENSVGMEYKDSTAGINGVYDQSNTTEIARYSLDGTRIDSATKGINIVKTSDGKTVKVLVK